MSSISISHSGRARTESFGDVVRCGLVKLICTIRCRNGTPSFAYMRIWQSRNGIWSIWNGLISGAVDFVGNEIGMYFFPLLLYGKDRWRFKNDFWFTDMTVQFHTLRRFVDIMRKKIGWASSTTTNINIIIISVNENQANCILYNEMNIEQPNE